MNNETTPDAGARTSEPQPRPNAGLDRSEGAKETTTTETPQADPSGPVRTVAVCAEQIRQERPGPAWYGSVPYRVVAQDWIFEGKWIVQDLIGGLSRMEEADILADPLFDPDTHN